MLTDVCFLLLRHHFGISPCQSIATTLRLLRTPTCRAARLLPASARRRERGPCFPDPQKAQTSSVQLTCLSPPGAWADNAMGSSQAARGDRTTPEGSLGLARSGGHALPRVVPSGEAQLPPPSSTLRPRGATPIK